MNDAEERLIRHQTEAMNALAQAVNGLREAAGHGMVTRQDLAAAEARLTLAVQTPSAEDIAILASVTRETERITKRLERLDSRTPPK